MTQLLSKNYGMNKQFQTNDQVFLGVCVINVYANASNMKPFNHKYNRQSINNNADVIVSVSVGRIFMRTAYH